MPWKYNVTARSEKRETDRFLLEICTRVKFGAFTWNPASVPATSQLSTVLDAATYPELTGLRTGMAIKVIPPAAFPAGLILDASVDGDDSLTVLLSNFTGAPIDLGESDWPFMGFVI